MEKERQDHEAKNLFQSVSHRIKCHQQIQTVVPNRATTVEYLITSYLPKVSVKKREDADRCTWVTSHYTSVWMSRISAHPNREMPKQAIFSPGWTSEMQKKNKEEEEEWKSVSVLINTAYVRNKACNGQYRATRMERKMIPCFELLYKQITTQLVV